MVVPSWSTVCNDRIEKEVRALAPHSEQAPYYVYEVIDDFEVTLGKIAPWFDQPGGGTQIIKYKSNGRPYSIEELIELEVIKQINP